MSAVTMNLTQVERTNIYITVHTMPGTVLYIFKTILLNAGFIFPIVQVRK